MRFKRPTAHYGTSPYPETPYQKAGQVWDERIGSARVQAKNWRLMALGCLALSFATSGALIWRGGCSSTGDICHCWTLGQNRSDFERLGHQAFKLHLPAFPIRHDSGQRLEECLAMMRMKPVAELVRDDVVDRIDRCFNEPCIQDKPASGRHGAPAVAELSDNNPFR